MILYTIMPNDWIFPPEQDYSNPLENFYYKGVLVTAERTLPSCYRVIKISSTNPNDYLSSEFQPGSYIDVANFEYIP